MARSFAARIFGKYVALRGVARVAAFVGWIMLFVGAVLALIGVGEVLDAFQHGGRFSAPSDAMSLQVWQGVLKIGGGFSTAWMGFIAVLLGEVIKVFLDIEENTADTVTVLEKLLATTEPDASAAASKLSAPVIERAEPVFR